MWRLSNRVGRDVAALAVLAWVVEAHVRCWTSLSRAGVHLLIVATKGAPLHT